ncbi:hypothetical protein F7C95_02405 [Opitutia bacterium ISCC 51]|nr:hypothetical protein F7C95_02405 [Opitutae bacterium ISCC 51]QXD28845.1 hypothetical protein GA003_02385 [Opitutae bacterium ISCC 52]
MQCHTPAAGYALSFNTRQLNRDQMIDGQERNLLEHLSDIGILDTGISEPDALPQFSSADDEEASLLARVRSYLAVNCVSCHQPGAVASTSWDARPHIGLLETGLIEGLPLNDGGDSNRRLIKPGELDLSVLLSRISESHGFTRMPNVATNELDQDWIDLMTEWIDSVTTGFVLWQDDTFANPESLEADPQSDPDLDQQTNTFEYLVSTDALDAGSVWPLEAAVNSDQVTLTIPVTQNRSHEIQVSDDLKNWDVWSSPGNPFQVGEELVASVLVTGPYSPNRFFRIQVSEQ